IRHLTVTGVQTCALPISTSHRAPPTAIRHGPTNRRQPRELTPPNMSRPARDAQPTLTGRPARARDNRGSSPLAPEVFPDAPEAQIGRATCREREKSAVEA